MPKSKSKPSPLENGELTGRSPDGRKMLLFYGHSHPFSNFFPSSFRLEGREFSCGEQYFHYRKAVLFNDDDLKEQIMATSDPRKHKALGRKVRNYVEEEWEAACEGVMEECCLAKFGQSEELKTHLLCTAGATIVEASPRDRKWGVGLGIRNPASLDPSLWRGRNLLGLVLERARDVLANSQEKEEGQ